MGWKKTFTTKDPVTNKPTQAKVKTDKQGYVSDFLYGMEKDKKGGRHGHVWGLNNNKDSAIGGRSPKNKR